MATASSLPSRFDWISQHSLTPLARLAGILIDRKTRGRPSCSLSTGAIARKLGVCDRSAQGALRALSEAGLILIERDYGLSSRRRIVPSWRTASTEGGAR